MNEFIDIYKEHQKDIESFIFTTIKNNRAHYDDEISEHKRNFAKFRSMELLYITDARCKQITPNIYRKRYDDKAKGRNRDYLVERLKERSDNFYISDPYYSSATGNICITVMHVIDNGHRIFIDYRVSELLARLGLIEHHRLFDSFTKKVYQLIGFSLIFFAFLSLGYALFFFFKHILQDTITLDALFKPIVAITLGLAIFDLAKTILEREVYYKSYSKEGEDATVLTKFAIAIIIALSIEALMVVFKIAIHDYSQMIYGLYLIIGVGIVIISLGLYSYLTKKEK